MVRKLSGGLLRGMAGGEGRPGAGTVLGRECVLIAQRRIASRPGKVREGVSAVQVLSWMVP